MAETRYAYLPDGRRMDSREYWNTPEWRSISLQRSYFDGGRCVICHRPKEQTHHLDPRTYGHETITDIISVCDSCHQKFHDLWKPADFWKSDDNESHWTVRSLADTAKLCAMYWREDMYLGGEYGNNMCSLDRIRAYIDQYFIDTECTGSRTVIAEDDVQLFIRNKRYELWLNSGCDDILTFLDRQYGEKVRGGNPIRRDAEDFFYKKWIRRGQDPAAGMKETYEENKNILILMEEEKKYEQA